MRRALLLFAGIVAITSLEFFVYPGHSYLRGDTQLYVPMLERLDAPGFLSRDLVASNPHFAYTIYDEVTLLIHDIAHADLQRALEAQQIVVRAAEILGVFLLAISAGLRSLLAFSLAALINLGVTLGAPAISLVDTEPIPRAFAIGLLLLALGLFATEKPLLGGLAGGVALLYDLPIAAPVWAIVLGGFLFDGRLRQLFRPALTVLLVFLLLMANLAQLQPGEVDPGRWASRVSPGVVALQHLRTPYAWVSQWNRADLWAYLLIYVCGIWATARIWRLLNRQMRWFFIWLPLYGVLSIPISYVLLDRFGWSITPQLQPAQAVLFAVALSSIAYVIAAMRAALAGAFWESVLWFFALFSILLDARVFNLLNSSNLLQTGACLGLAGSSAILIARLISTKWRAAILLLPVIAIAAILLVRGVPLHPRPDDPALEEVAEWAQKNTWGSSMFLFPDAGKELYPGIFRAKATRAIWVDWMSGKTMTYSDLAGAEWWSRWRQTMENGFSPKQLQSELDLPIDYYVLDRGHSIPGVRPAFSNVEFAVYDAQDLRSFAGTHPSPSDRPSRPN